MKALHKRIIALCLAPVFCFGIFCACGNSGEAEGQVIAKEYNKDSILALLLDQSDTNKKSVRAELDVNSDRYIEILQYTDQILEGKPYKIYELYESGTVYYGTQDNVAYVVRVVLEEHMELFQQTSLGSESKYILMFYSTFEAENQPAILRNSYVLFQFGLEWEREVKEEFGALKNNSEELVVSYNIFLNLDGALAPREEVTTWKEAGEKGGFLGNESRLGNTVTILVPGGKQTEDQAESYIGRLSSLFSKYYIKKVNVLYLTQGIAVESMSNSGKLETSFSKESEEVEEIYSFSLDGTGKLGED